jgi:hypothetical protein
MEIGKWQLRALPMRASATVNFALRKGLEGGEHMADKRIAPVQQEMASASEHSIRVQELETRVQQFLHVAAIPGDCSSLH